ncbi:MAG: hypothetical protein R3344_03420 [Acidobacteriota bacterium]|nr:hypothetical protein [Acidobacteriota bacterium]
MANFRSRDFDGLADHLEEIARRNEEMARGLEGDQLFGPMLDAGFVIVARGKEILTEKGHVVTGFLRRSLNAQVRRKSRDAVETEVGSPAEYAPFVEALPDGGFLEEALLQRIPEVTRIIRDAGLEPVLVRWGR